MMPTPMMVSTPPTIICGVIGVPNTAMPTITDSKGVGSVSGDTVDTG